MVRTKTKPRRFTDDERTAALAALAANGGNVGKTSRQLKISETTIRQWAKGTRHPEAAQASGRKIEDLAAKLEAVAWQLVEAIPGKIDKAPLNQTAVAAGIAIDKMQLLRGLPTAINRTEIEEMTDEQLDAEITRLAGGEGSAPGIAPGA